jgi:hypothetical protein
MSGKFDLICNLLDVICAATPFVAYFEWGASMPTSWVLPTGADASSLSNHGFSSEYHQL